MYTNNSTNYGGVLFSVHQNCRCRSAFQWGSNPWGRVIQISMEVEDSEPNLMCPVNSQILK